MAQLETWWWQKATAIPSSLKADETLAGGAGVAASAMRQFFNSAALASASQGAEIDVEYFTCCVDGIHLSGHFYRVEFGEGDEMEFVVLPVASGAAVHAARNPASRLIWTLPYQTRGHQAQVRFNLKWILFTSVACSVGPTLFFVYSRPHGNLPPWMISTLLLGFFVITALIGVLVAWKFLRFSRDTTAILETFGYENAATVSLPAIHNVAEKERRKANGGTGELFHPWRFRY
ncbi:MAG: putative type VI secretion system effector [Telluria sp.]